MGDISTWSSTDSNNNSASPDGFPENMAPSGVNDSARAVMGAVRRQWQDGEWFNWGDTVSYNASNSFKVTGDVTSRYLVGRRVKLYDASTLYAHINASSYSAPDTTVTIIKDSGSLSTSLSSVALALISGTNTSVPFRPVFQTGQPVYAAAGGSSNSYSIALSVTPPEYTTGMMVRFKANANNTGAATINVNSLGDKSIVKGSATTLASGDISANQVVTAVYDGTNFQMLNMPNTAGLILQVVSQAISAVSGGTDVIPGDDTTPLISEGAQVCTKTIVLNSTSSRVEIFAAMTGAVTGSSPRFIAALFRSDTCLATALGAADAYSSTVGFTLVDSPATSGTVTYSIRVGTTNASGPYYCNVATAGTWLNGTLANQQLVLKEYVS